MQKIKYALFACLSFWCLTGHAQTAEEIVNKHIAAIGGKRVIQSTTSLYAEGTVEVMGNTGQITTQILYGKGYKYEAEFQGGTVISAVTEKGGWRQNPMAGVQDPTPMTDAEAKAARIEYAPGEYNSVLIDYAAKGNKVTFEGRDSTAGMNLLKLKVTTIDSMTIEFFIDPMTYYSTKIITSQYISGKEQTSTIYYKDYRKLDNGLVRAYGAEIVTPMYTVGVTEKQIMMNKVIDPAIFEIPK